MPQCLVQVLIRSHDTKLILCDDGQISFSTMSVCPDARTLSTNNRCRELSEVIGDGHAVFLHQKCESGAAERIHLFI